MNNDQVFLTLFEKVTGLKLYVIRPNPGMDLDSHPEDLLLAIKDANNSGVGILMRAGKITGFTVYHGEKKTELEV